MRNPYHSYLVRASAGSGKTYQLSQRFLQLVAAHQQPGSILTVTFTNKAASEMRERIIAEAARLVRDDGSEFDREALTYWEEHNRPGPRPLSARQVGQLILDQTQSLAITTIDALYFEWAQHVPAFKGMELVDPLTHLQLQRDAFEALCVWLSRHGGIPEVLADLSVEAIRTRLLELQRHESSIWLARHRYGEDALVPWEHHGPPPSDPFAICGNDLAAIVAQVANVDRREKMEQALAAKSLPGCVEAGLLNKALQVSGSLIRGKKREAMAAEIARADDALLAYLNFERKQALNASGRMQMQLREVYDELYATLKGTRGVLDFGDLARAAFHLMHDDQFAGSRYAVIRQIRHLMIDEFQDTSRLQWQIFSPVVDELTAGEGVHQDGQPTVFFVGDEKQSIYGFREADPTVMDSCAETLGERLNVVSMATSYRTAPVVLDFVNAVFAQSRMSDFPEHTTARLGDQWFVRNQGQVGLFPLCTGNEEENAGEQEAAQIARLVGELLAAETAVYERSSGTYRPLRAGDIGILYRAGTNAGLYEEALHAAHIPVMREEERGFFARPEIDELLQLGRWLAAPDDTTALCSVLRGPLFGISEETLFTMLARAERSTEKALLSRFVEHAEIETLEQLAAMARAATPPHVVFCDAFAKLGVTRKLSEAFGDSEAERRLIAGNLGRFLELILTAEADGQSNLLACMRTLLARADLDDMGNAGVTSDAVNLMTIHKSKGLEFPVVILADTGRPFGSKDRYWLRLTQDDRSRLFHMGVKADQPVGDAACDWVADEFEGAVCAETERLLYVALTRAQQYLWITGHDAPGSQGFSSTCFHARLATALERCNAQQRTVGGEQAWVLTRTEDAPWQAEAEEAAPVAALPPKPPSLPETEVAPMTKSLAKGLFAEAAIDLLPPPLDMPADAYGNLVHAGIEAALRGLPSPELPAAIRCEVEQTLALLRPLLNEAEAVLPEHPCVLLRGEKVLTGIIDLLIITADTAHIIDFKTSRLARPSAKNLRAFSEARGYDRQVALYTRVVQQSFPTLQLRSALLYTAAPTWLEV